MKAVKLNPKVWVLHADIESKDLFEGIWPIPEGVSLNSYLVKGQKTALVDLMRDWCSAPEELKKQLADAGVDLTKIDYLILNHLEPDHTGWLAEFKKINPTVEIIATAKGVELVKSFYKINDGLRAVKSGDVLDLGGVTLCFEEVPNVHWPETMATFEPESGVLFSCDAFGSYGKLGNRVFDDEYYAEDHALFEEESLRYYANIVASFSLFVKKAIEKLVKLPIKVVAPSHGLIWREKPQTIIDRYLKFANYMEGPQEKEICVVWGSMYGNTRLALEALLQGIEDELIPYSIHRVPDEDVAFVLADAYKSAGIVIAMPTYEYKMFPPMAYVLNMFERKHVWNRQALRIGSWGWVGGAKKEYEAAIAPLKWTSLESIEWAGAANDAVLTQLREQGRELARAVKAG
ncbi:MAG: MBL fold metallo-hydrolase [Spirochaetes bacterium GWD1_61_31]|nr:MAG: MBL fold metallo-hydrolase [Spirochaetes bacterium GWB1_60_80]OHD34889.1 MAG: MBL fold metallo-hydrolase [Spirochaetes bacterium GWC1_61_12]OHD37081.1 MAG: MBL fold metallo-hydrolase [Spirochaetes bacterium GWD1_61_31]OHD44654.1 MAG: MBL fold metallo-hydrolase [Spirochaetes bacterium GWE1_60_18]OHD61060.1 MAG: MBL fold metallo-hydrolase [Spirochaetes bacterium GWF1_60_12]HAP42718.1 MBL fold metallo-hydrolase [Spirochaetaceae bacterium]